MFNREDYFPYMFGVFVFAGLIAVPMIWGRFIDLPFHRLIVGSMVGCFIYAQAHSRTGEFSIGRFAIGMLIGFALTLKASMTANAYLPGGFLGFAMMAGGGWLGIWLGRVSGITATLDNSDPTDLKTYDGSDPAELKSGDHSVLAASGSKDPDQAETQKTDYLFDDIAFRQFMKKSRQAWTDGKLADLSDQFAETAADKSLQDFRKMFDGMGFEAREVFLVAFKHHAPLDDEIVVAAENGGVQLSFVLTNKYLYFFGLDDRILANKFERGKLAIANIKECNLLKKGWIYNKIEIVLKSGKIIPLKVTESSFPMGHLAKLIEKSAPDTDS